MLNDIDFSVYNSTEKTKIHVADISFIRINDLCFYHTGVLSTDWSNLHLEHTK